MGQNEQNRLSRVEHDLNDVTLALAEWSLGGTLRKRVNENLVIGSEGIGRNGGEVVTSCMIGDILDFIFKVDDNS